jgi:hypothetical protein
MTESEGEFLSQATNETQITHKRAKHVIKKGDKESDKESQKKGNTERKANKSAKRSTSIPFFYGHLLLHVDVPNQKQKDPTKRQENSKERQSKRKIEPNTMEKEIAQPSVSWRPPVCPRTHSCACSGEKSYVSYS